MRLAWDLQEYDELILVTARVHNPAPVKRYVRLQNHLDGKVRPPRSNGIPERGWDVDGVTITIPAQSVRGVGYACKADRTSPPLGIESTGRGNAPDADAPTRAHRLLDTFRPPRNAVTGIHAESSHPVVTDEDAAKQSRSGLMDDGISTSNNSAEGCTADETVSEKRTLENHTNHNNEPANNEWTKTPQNSESVEQNRTRGMAGDDQREERTDQTSHTLSRARRRIEFGMKLEKGGVATAIDVLEALRDSTVIDANGIAGLRSLDTELRSDEVILEEHVDEQLEQAISLRKRAKELQEAADRIERAARTTSQLADRAGEISLPIEILERLT